ncbi:MAG: hypothetical protein M3495_09690, partial [Pseudomonadota bacterium]|nr:hypothetical protein [Pseudomonadota bacterium]
SQPEGSGEEAQTGVPLGTGAPDTGADGARSGPGQAPDTGTTAGGTDNNAGAGQAPPAGGASPDRPTTGLPEAPPAVPAETPSAQDGGILEAIPSGTITLGIAIALILLSVGVAMRRKRAAEVAPIDEGFPDSEPLAEPWDTAAREGLPQEETMAKGRAVVGETTGPVTVLGIADTVPPVAEAANEPEEEDPLSDINVYLAYERFDEAEETVKHAIAGNPDEHKLKLKLLEVYYAAGNNAAFEQYARVLQSAVHGTGPLWHSALAMWQAMSPERALFAPATGGEPIFATTAPREFIDISSTSADTQAPPPAVGREKSLPATTAGGRTLEVLDFDLTGVGTSITPDRERVVDISAGNELEWDGSGLVVDTARATQGGGAPIDLGAGGVREENSSEVLDLTVGDAPGHSSPDGTVTESAGVMSTADRTGTASATAERFGTATGAAATVDFDFGDGPEKQTQDTGVSGALEGTGEVMFNLGTTAGEASTPARVDTLLGGETIDLEAPVWPKALLEAGRASARSTLADDHRFSTAPNREERDRVKEDSVEFDLGEIDLEVVETGPPEPIETATVVDTLGFGGPTRASVPPASTTPASTIDLSLGSRLALDPGALEPGDDGIGLDEDTSSGSDVKLNLAKAYIELGDAEGARAILQEVTREGTSAERDEAAQLLAQIA